MVTWFGREPAVLVGAVVAAVIAVVALLPLDVGLTAGIAAVVTATGGVVVAAAVTRDAQLPAILGLVRAGLALLVILGVDGLTDQYQALILVAVEAVFALFVRTQVDAPVAAAEVGGHALTRR